MCFVSRRDIDVWENVNVKDVQSFPVSYKKMNVDLIDKNEFQFQALQLSMHEGLRIIYGLTSVTP